MVAVAVRKSSSAAFCAMGPRRSLTEHRENANGAQLRERLRANGFVFQSPPRSSTGNTVLVASSLSFETRASAQPALAWQHRHVWVSFDELEVCALYFPQQAEKVPLLDRLLALPPAIHQRPALLTGDFNTGRHNLDEARATFYCADKFEALLASVGPTPGECGIPTRASSPGSVLTGTVFVSTTLSLLS